MLIVQYPSGMDLRGASNYLYNFYLLAKNTEFIDLAVIIGTTTTNYGKFVCQHCLKMLYAVVMNVRGMLQERQEDGSAAVGITRSGHRGARGTFINLRSELCYLL